MDMMLECNIDGRSGVIPRFAHALGDGISLVQLFLKVLSDKDGAAVPLPSFIRAAPSAASPRKSESKTPKARVSGVGAAKAIVSSIAGAVVKVAMLPVKGCDTTTAIRDTARPFKWSQARTLVLVCINTTFRYHVACPSHVLNHMVFV